MDLKDHVIEYMKTLYNEHKKTQVTVLGHSLGAAMATFAAIDLENEGIHINTFYIYGYH
jgi:surfactin synthase thioesterase subunit